MKTTAIALTLIALATAACSGADPAPAPGQPAEDTAASTSEALTTTPPPGVTNITFAGSVTIGACTYRIGSGTSSSLPPQSVVLVEKGGGRLVLGARCKKPGYQVVGQTYQAQSLSIAAGANGEVAVGYVGKDTPSGEAHYSASMMRLDPEDLSTQATAALRIFPLFPPTGGDNVDSVNLVFTVPGNLIVTGTKEGIFQEPNGPVYEMGAVGGHNYQATFPGFATATGAVAFSQILAW